MRRIAIAGALLLVVAPALAHDGYSNWVNRGGEGCCNDRDCKPLAGDEERVTIDPVTRAATLVVNVDGEWCPVLEHHYLKSGNAPDYATAHVCIDNPKPEHKTKCDRLLCYQPRPSF